MIYRRLFDTPSWGWGSLNELERMKRQMEQLFGNMLEKPNRTLSSGVFPLVNLTENKDAYFIRAELPGLKADEIDIQATGDRVSVSGERKIQAENETAKYHRREREAGKFSRVINLPKEINAEKIEAHLVDGILTVTVPKADKTKPRQITVK